MIRMFRIGAAAAAAALVVLTPLSSGQARPAPSPLPPGAWPQAASDLKADPEIRFGVLPNGMRYAIRRQTIPPGQAALRLWFGTGALQESDSQQGLAHFLEHMAFNGSKGVPEGEMIRILERLGLAFGPDTNASTGFDETVYKLDLPRTDPVTLDTALMLLRETAGELTIDGKAVDRERGVVLSEERARDTPGYRILKQRLVFLFPGQRLPDRMPIGMVEILRSAPASAIASYYHAYYRPERAVLVAAGDFDVAAMEAKIRDRFAGWAPQGPAGADPDLGAVRRRGEAAKLVVEPGAAFGLQLVWASPPELAPASRAKERRRVVEQLGLAVLNRRFSALARGAEPPFLAAGAYKFDQTRSAELATLNVTAEPDRWRPALEAVDREERRIVRYGVRQDELDREVVEMRARLTNAVQGAATRRPQDLADEIAGSLSEGEVVTSPAQDLALFDEIVKGLSAREVSAAVRRAFTGSGPLLFAASPKPIEGGEATLLAALAQSRKAAVAPPPAPAQVAWPYASFGPPGKVAEQRVVEDLGATLVRFENGVRLTVKSTKFRENEVLVRANVGRGLLDLSPEGQSAAWAGSALVEGGLKKISSEDMERVLAAKVYGVRFTAADDAFVLSGGTRTEDLPTELEVLAAYVAQPGWREEAFRRLKANGKTLHDQYEATDFGVLGRDLAGTLRAGDRRWTFPSREEIADARLSELQTQVGRPLAEGPIEVVVVGDVTVEAAIAETARTFGSLPPRPAPQLAPVEMRRVGFPAPNAKPLELLHKGRDDQAIGFIAWPTSDIWADPRRAFATAVLGEVLRNRLTDQLREAEGVTYSPSVSYAHSTVWEGWGYMSASVEVPPEKLPAFFDDVRKIADDLRARPVGDDELARARQPRLENLQRARVTNQYWLSELSGAQADPRRLQLTRDVVPVTSKVGAADLQAAAQLFLRDDKAFRLEVRPQKP